MGVSGQRHALVALCAGERTTGTHCAGGWVGPGAGLDTEVRGKSFAPAGNRIPIVQSVVRHCINWATPAPNQSMRFFDIGGLAGLQLCFSIPSSFTSLRRFRHENVLVFKRTGISCEISGSRGVESEYDSFQRYCVVYSRRSRPTF
jgi:hypothetical protein